MIEVKNITKSYGKEIVLENLSVSISSGSVVVVIGASGSGKSTFIRLLNGLERFDSGEINICGIQIKTGRSIDQVRRKVGMVFQGFNLFPHLTVLENICLGPIYVNKEKKTVAQESAQKLLDRVGLTSHKHKYPHELSGGQQQRVAIARALALKPEVLLFDEPTSALDPEMTAEVLLVMKELAQSGMTMIVVTHEMEFAKNVGSRILFFDEKKITEDCSPIEFFNQPKTMRAKKFLGQFRL